MDKKKVKSVRGRTADVVLRVCEVLLSGEASSSKVEVYAVVGKEFGVLPKTVKSAYSRHGENGHAFTRRSQGPRFGFVHNRAGSRPGRYPPRFVCV
jgi:hypothetical protein